MAERLKYNLQPIRVPSGWAITINNLYEVDFIEENLAWFSSSVLIGGEHRNTGYCFDCRLESESGLNGGFVVEFIKIKYDYQGRPIRGSDSYIGQKRTKTVQEIISVIEAYMLEIR
ncbi:hypothetical protein HKW97_24360 (plasmid) [Pseudomonas luteola]|uniref:hypothetical protein n=1 Tax=Pseudomonas luteola TaxID=47886 RepID=UPI00388E9F9B